MKGAILTFVLASSLGILNAQVLSEASTISLLTGSPGSELYSTFGHSAIRVHDPSQQLDLVFNYGTFDFRTPNFYLKFTQGKLKYMLSIQQFDGFLMDFKAENRSLTEQVLNLDLNQRRKLLAMLLENYQPENRYYKYDFFFDNCATRIRDIMLAAFGDDFKYHFPDRWSKDELTFRNLIDLYLTDHDWSDFGIDIALGLPTDDVATPTDYMFLPDYLSEGFGLAKINSSGKWVPLVSSKKLILPRLDVAPHVFFITPVRLMWTLFVVFGILSWVALKRNINIGWLDKLYFSIIGLVGWIVFLLWFFTDHIATKDNLNLLWAVPIYFPLFLLWGKIDVGTKKVIFMVFGGIDMLILLMWWIWPQSYHVAFIPLILMVLMRFVCNFISMEKERISDSEN